MAVEWYLQSFLSGDSQLVPTQKIMPILSKYPFITGNNCLDITLPEDIVSFYFKHDIKYHDCKAYSKSFTA